MIQHYIKSLLLSIKRQKGLVALNFMVLTVSMIVLTIVVGTFKDILFTTNIDSNGEKICFLRRNSDHGRNNDLFGWQEKRKLQRIEVPAKCCITSAAPFSFHPSKGGNLKDFEGRYVNENYLNLLKLDFIKGSRFTKKHVESNQRVIIINKSVALYVFGTTDVVGKEILVFDKMYKIIGVFENMSMASRNFSVAYVPEEFCTWEKMTWNISYAANNLDKENMEKTLNKHANEIFENKNHSFQLISKNEFIAENLKRFGFLSVFILILALILPTLLMSNIIVTRMETKINELGIRKAFGANKKVIFVQLLSENLAITLIGGVFAIIIGQFIVSNMLYEEENFTFGNIFNIPISTYLIIILFYVAFGIISGIYPSRIIAKKSVVSSLNAS